MNPTIKYYKIFLSLTFLRKCKKSVANSWERETGPTIVRLMRLCKSGGGLWWPTTVTAKPKTSRQKQNTSRQNQKPHGKNKIPHGKTKNLTAKPNTSQQKQNSFGFAVGICFCREVFGFCCEVFGFAVRFLVLSWGILFLLWDFWFCREVFVFAMRFLVLPWQLWATVVVRRQCLQFCNYFTDCNA